MNTEKRPWGKFTVIEDEKTYKLKRIAVEPGQRLSYQSHKKRDENWTIVNGTAAVTLNGKKYELKYGESVFIERNVKHRIENTGNNIVEFIEVQTGEYFGEDDIIRYEDDYNRS